MKPLTLHDVVARPGFPRTLVIAAMFVLAAAVFLGLSYKISPLIILSGYHHSDLMLAVHSGRIDVVQTRLQNAADVNLRNRYGQDAISVEHHSRSCSARRLSPSIRSSLPPDA